MESIQEVILSLKPGDVVNIGLSSGLAYVGYIVKEVTKFKKVDGLNAAPRMVVLEQSNRVAYIDAIKIDTVEIKHE